MAILNEPKASRARRRKNDRRFTAIHGSFSPLWGDGGTGTNATGAGQRGPHSTSIFCQLLRWSREFNELSWSDHNIYTIVATVPFLQNLDFITYQLKRTTITTFVHLSLPLVYCIGMSVVEPNVYSVSWNKYQQRKRDFERSACFIKSPKTKRRSILLLVPSSVLLYRSRWL